MPIRTVSATGDILAVRGLCSYYSVISSENICFRNRGVKDQTLRLKQIQLRKYDVDSKQSQASSAPDHSGRPAAQGPDEFALALPRNEKRRVVGSLHHDNGRREIEAGRRRRWGFGFGANGNLRDLRRGNSDIVVGDSGRSPGSRIGDAGASKRGGDFGLLCRVRVTRRMMWLGQADDRRWRIWTRTNCQVQAL